MNASFPMPVVPTRRRVTRRSLVGAAWGAVLIALVLTACDTTGPAPFERQIVVESYQVAGEPLAPVRLTRTVPLDSTYRYEDLAVQDAAVVVERLAPDGGVAHRHPYVEAPDSLGFYRPDPEPGPVETVRPLRDYRLVATLPDGSVVRSTTTVPDTFSIVRASRDTAIYQLSEQIAFTVTPSRTSERDQSYYVFTTIAQEPTEANLVPLVREFLDDSDDFTLDDARVTSSPVINEANYTTNPDGTLTIRLPWVSVAFYGPNRTRASVVDDNLYDYTRSQAGQQGGGGFTPGSIPSILEHVEGGTGIFGSLARVEYAIFIARPPGSDASRP